ncbi:papain family cysteine protease [Ostertagia ostertagi]
MDAEEVFRIRRGNFWVKHSFVTGGNYTSKNCRTYGSKRVIRGPDDADNHVRHSRSVVAERNQVLLSARPRGVIRDQHSGATAYIVSKKVTDIQKEIMTNGPVEVSYNVYEDFGSCTGGIYVVCLNFDGISFPINQKNPLQHTAGALRGGHAVKMIGWGTENGFFRIIRGLDECGIESGVVAGEPKL